MDGRMFDGIGIPLMVGIVTIGLLAIIGPPGAMWFFAWLAEPRTGVPAFTVWCIAQSIWAVMGAVALVLMFKRS